MKDNLSLVILMIFLVLLVVIFPLYNYFERQDDMSYNLALKAATNFADEVMNNGYIDIEMYNKFLSLLSNTGVNYNIKMEAHRKILTKETETSTNQYIEQYEIDYNEQILPYLEGEAAYTSGEKVRVKPKTYALNPGDQFYVRLENSGTTMAGAIFNTIVPTAKKERIVVDYGGVIKSEAWKPVEYSYENNANKIDGNIRILVIDNRGTGSMNLLNYLQGRYPVVDYNPNLSLQQILDGNYSIIISDNYVWAPTQATLINALFARGKNILTIGNDSTQALDIIDSSTNIGNSVLEMYKNPNSDEKILQNVVDNFGTRSDSSRVLVNSFKVGTQIWFYQKYNGMSYPAMGYLAKDGVRWIHLQEALNQDLLNMIPSIIDKLLGRI